MQRIGLRPALPMILEAYPHRQAEEIGEVLLEPLVAGDFAAKVGSPGPAGCIGI
jgi:hypothetical protein